MLKRLIYICLWFAFTINFVESSEFNFDWIQPKISKDSNRISHIFRDSVGHLNEDNLKNRTFIEAATAHPKNKIGIDGFGNDIYLRTMPDGTQAWALVRNGEITNGGCNNFPKEWIADSSEAGGYFITPKFAKYNSNDKTFQGHLVVNSLVSAYKAHHQIAQLSIPLSERKIRGVAGRYGKIINLLDSTSKKGEHTLLLPTNDLSEKEVFQILRDVAKGDYIYDALPFFSLHYNRQLISYPVIHPVYRNTLTGQAIAMLDYYMKGFANGRSFDENFIYSWDANRKKDLDLLFDNSFEFKTYCNSLGLEYKTYNELLEQVMGEDSYHGIFIDSFDISYRITAKQNAITRNGNTLSFTPDFDVIGTVKGNPVSEAEEKHYKYLRQACELMCTQIKEILPKLPICRKYFQILYLGNFFSYYCNTLKEQGMIPILQRDVQEVSFQGCPNTFPPIPLFMENEVQISFIKLLDVFNESEIKEIVTYFKASHPTSGMISRAVDLVYDGIYLYFTREGIDSKLSPDQCGDIAAKVLEYTRKRYQSIQKNISDVLKGIRVEGSPDDPNTQQNFLIRINELLPHLTVQERQEILKFRDKFNQWFTNPLSYSFEQAGVAFGLIDGSLKFILNCEDQKIHLAGGCGVAVDDIEINHSLFLGYFHRGTKINITYSSMDSETSEERREEAIGLLYPPKSEYQFNDAIFQVLQAILNENIELFDKVKESVQDWEFKDPYGISLVHHAATAKNPYFLRYLIQQRVNLLAKDEQGFTALHHAAQAGSLECIKLLVQEDFTLIEMKAQDGETPLFIAVQNGAYDAIDLFLELNANPNCTIINDLSALMWAIQCQDETISLKLLDHQNIDIDYSLKGNISAIELAIDMQLPQVLRKLVDLGANVYRKAEGSTLLCRAVTLRYVEGIKILLESPTTQMGLLSSRGGHALTLARRLGYKEVERLLISYLEI